MFSFQPPSSSIKLMLGQLTEIYQANLPGSPGESALIQRGLSLETIQHFRLGFVSDPSENYYGRVTVPFLTSSGVVVIRYKSVNGLGAKEYLHELGMGAVPYNVASLHADHEYLDIVEGLPDTWTAWQLGMNPLGIPGAETWKPVFGRMCKNYRVRAWCHGDAAGTDMGSEIQRVVPRVKIIQLPTGEDINSLFQSFGPECLDKYK